MADYPWTHRRASGAPGGCHCHREASHLSGPSGEPRMQQQIQQHARRRISTGAFIHWEGQWERQDLSGRQSGVTPSSDLTDILITSVEVRAPVLWPRAWRPGPLNNASSSFARRAFLIYALALACSSTAAQPSPPPSPPPAGCRRSTIFASRPRCCANSKCAGPCRSRKRPS